MLLPAVPVPQYPSLELPDELYHPEVDAHCSPEGEYQLLDSLPPLDACGNETPNPNITPMLLRFSGPDDVILLIWLKLGATSRMTMTREKVTAVEWVIRGPHALRIDFESLEYSYSTLGPCGTSYKW